MLTEIAIRHAQRQDRWYRLHDRRSLYLEIRPTGRKLWRWRYRWQRRARLLALGEWPDVTLAAARERSEEARKLLRAGIDPATTPSLRLRRAGGAAPDSFEALATRWWEDRRRDWTEAYAQDVWRRFELHAFPALGSRAVAEITPLELWQVLRPLMAQGARKETVRRLRQKMGEVFRLAVVEGLRADDPSALIVDLIPPVTPTPMRTIHEEDVPALLEALAGAGSRYADACLRLALLTAVRPSEVVNAAWAELDIAAALWTIPASRMKRRREHCVPLARQALALLTELRPLSGHRRHLFPHRSDPRRPMSLNTLYAVLRRIGWHDRLTPHGLRSLFSTAANDRKFAPPDVVDAALAHVQRSKVQRAYDRGVRLRLRQRLMQRWADHIDHLIAEADAGGARQTAS